MREQHERGHGQRSWRWHWALPLCPIAASMFCLSALVYYHTVLQGTGEAWGFFQGIVVGLYRWVGFVPTFMFWLLVFAWCSVWFVTGRFERAWARLGWMAAFSVSLAVLVNLGTDALAPPPHAGVIGTFLAVRLVSVLGVVFSALLALGAAMASLFLATDFLFYRYFEAMARGRGATEQGVEPEATEAFRELAFAGIYGDAPRAGADAMPQARRRIVLEDDSASGPAGGHDAVRAGEPPETEEFGGEWDPDTVDPETVDTATIESSEEEPAHEPTVELLPHVRGVEPAAAEVPAAYEIPRPSGPAIPTRVDLAAREVLAAGRASVTLLRRRLGCSPHEAQELLDALRDHGVVDGVPGAPQGGLVTTLAEWEAR